MDFKNSRKLILNQKDRMSNPFHQYDTRFKAAPPQRTNANVPWQTTGATYTYNPVGTTSARPAQTSAPVYFSNGSIVPAQQFWGSFGKPG